MALIRIFKTPKHSKFDYNPQYWDPQKEELEERLDSVKKRHTDDPEALRSRISRGFRRGGDGGAVTRGYRSSQVQRSNRTLVIVLAVLVLLFLLLFNMYAPEMQEMLEPGSQI